METVYYRFIREKILVSILRLLSWGKIRRDLLPCSEKRGPSKAKRVNLIKISLLGSYRWQPHHEYRICGLLTCILLN
jgi:hypothetical protein